MVAVPGSGRRRRAHRRWFKWRRGWWSRFRRKRCRSMDGSRPDNIALALADLRLLDLLMEVRFEQLLYYCFM